MSVAGDIKKYSQRAAWHVASGFRAIAEANHALAAWEFVKAALAAKIVQALEGVESKK